MDPDAPSSGYDTATRVEDIRQFLDALKVKKANIAAHSIGGSEMTVLASLYPKRVKRLVYLDGAIDHTCNAKLEIEPWLSPDDKRGRFALRNDVETTEILAAGWSLDRWAANKATNQAVDIFQPNYTKVKAPSLVIYRRLDRADPPRGASEAMRKEMDAWYLKNGYHCAMQSRQQVQQQLRRGQVVEIQYAYHYIFLGPAREEVVSLMREFLLR